MVSAPTLSQPFRNFVPNLVYSASGAEVDNGFINGRRMMADSRLEFLRESALLAEADERAARIFASAESDCKMAGSMLIQHADHGHM